MARHRVFLKAGVAAVEPARGELDDFVVPPTPVPGGVGAATDGTPAAAPEPGTLCLVAAGLAGLASRRIRKS